MRRRQKRRPSSERGKGGPEDDWSLFRERQGGTRGRLVHLQREARGNQRKTGPSSERGRGDQGVRGQRLKLESGVGRCPGRCCRGMGRE